MPDSVSIPSDVAFPDGTVSVLKDNETGYVYLVHSWDGVISIMTMNEETAVALGKTLVNGEWKVPATSQN